MHLQVIFLATLLVLSNFGQSSAQNAPHCKRTCGNITIPFPFGLEEGCYHSKEFHLTCNRSLDPPTPFYGNKAVTDISPSNGEMEIMMSVAHKCYNSVTTNTDTNFNFTTFQFSTKNRFVAIGCNTFAYILSISRKTMKGFTGCISTCESIQEVKNGFCSGSGCCEVAIPEGMTHFSLEPESFDDSNILDFSPCNHAFVTNKKFNFSSSDLRGFENVDEMPRLLDWAIGSVTCDIARNDTNKFLCKGINSDCDKNYTGPGYRCKCNKGYAGNPYVEDGCVDIDECKNPDLNDCVSYEYCENTNGSYECECPNGLSRDGRKSGSGCNKDQTPPKSLNQSYIITITICTLAATIFLLVLVISVCVGIKKHKGMKLREKFFKKNGGIMLQQRISGNRGSHDQAKVFTVEELKSATNNYDENMIIGKGGYGTVYKGVLSDDRIVAIKKSKLPDETESQIEQFINEVVILSQVNHRNVVKLIGCCLETEVPSLVYEFIPNGTLFDHIHNKSKSLAITWEIRLRIATETAGALSYLHSEASVPIIHRDVKPMNILLDENYVAKVADFGASRFIPMDQIELATIVQGTLGYLDPEYLHTSQLTDKSDVYSFGVVLVELLTGKMVLCFDRPEKERNIAMYFLSSLEEGGLLHVLDEHLELNEVPAEIIQVSRLAQRCLHVKGDERPTMKEVAMELEGIMASMTYKHPWVQSSSNEEENEYLLNVSTEDVYGYTSGSNTSSTTFDSMSKHAIVPIASGR